MSKFTNFYEKSPAKDTVKKIPIEDVKDLQYAIRKGDPFPLEATETRNVLIVGRTRSGKSTAIGVLKDPCHEPKEMSIFSDTVDPKFQSFSLDNKDPTSDNTTESKKTKYTLNIIDTPGLKEVKKMGEDARSDAIILNTISYCLKNEITKINILLIFISFELGVTNDDLNSFQTFLQNFENDNIKIGICITRAEDKPESWRKNIKFQLSEHEYFSKVLQRGNVELVFCGCVDSLKNETVSNIDDLVNFYRRVCEMRRDLLELIFTAKDQAKLVDLPIASTVKKKTITDLFDMQFKILDYLTPLSDLETSTVKNKLVDFGSNIDAMVKNEAIILDSEMQIRFQKMKEMMKPIYVRLPDNLKSGFAGKVNMK